MKEHDHVPLRDAITQETPTKVLALTPSLGIVQGTAKKQLG